MKILYKLIILGSILPTAVYSATPCCKNVDPPTPVAATNDFSSFVNNSTLAATLRPAMTNYISNKEIGDLGFNLYKQDNIIIGNTIGSIYSSLVNVHNNYCSTNLNAEKPNCAAKFGDPNTQFLELGDIKFASLVQQLGYSASTAIAAQYIIRNIVNPFPVSQVANMSSDSGAAKSNYAKYLAQQATLGVALHSFNQMYSMRLGGSPFPTLGASSTQASLMSVMQNEATRRFLKPDFAKFLQASTTNTTDMLRELAAMDAFLEWMSYMRYKQRERISALLASSLSNDIITPGLASKLQNK